MPCCAFAACIVAQFLLGAHAIRRALFGRGRDEPAARNLAVEWRLDSAAAPLDLAPVSARRLPGRGLSLRGLAFAVALELVIAAGAIYGVIDHLGHGTGHSGHPHRTEGVGRDRGMERGGALHPNDAALPGTFSR